MLLLHPYRNPFESLAMLNGAPYPAGMPALGQNVDLSASYGSGSSLRAGNYYTEPC